MCRGGAGRSDSLTKHARLVPQIVPPSGASYDPHRSEMLQELSHMDRITQLQDEIQQILVIMSNTISYLTTRTNFLQVGQHIPVTKQRKAEKFDPPDVFEANQRELVADLVTKAKQIEYLINSLPQPEPEETQARRLEVLENEMAIANEDYIRAVHRAKDLHSQISDVLKMMLDQDDTDLLQPAR